MTKRKLTISIEDLIEIIDDLESIVKKITKIIPKVEDTISNLMEREEILDHCNFFLKSFLKVCKSTWCICAV